MSVVLDFPSPDESIRQSRSDAALRHAHFALGSAVAQVGILAEWCSDAATRESLRRLVDELAARPLEIRAILEGGRTCL